MIHKIASVIALAAEMKGVNMLHWRLLQSPCKLDGVVIDQVERVLGLLSGIEDASGTHQVVWEVL